MAHKEQRAFCASVKEKYPDFFKNKRVLDIGSLDINGSNNYLFEDCTYIGLDLAEGKNVDTIGVGHLYDAPNDYFDTIISTEVFEHDMFYEQTIANIIRMLKPGGLFVFTCAAPGRPEHGTRRTGGFDAPLLIKRSEEWADYYKNLTEVDVRKSPDFNTTFPDGYFEFKNTNIEIPADLYFYGIKGGSKYLIDAIEPKYPKSEFFNDIFVIDCWSDNESKENDLVNLIKRLRIYNIPILLTGHYPVKPEIQKMVDFYLFDKNNPLLTYDQFVEYGVDSVRWSNIGDVRIDNTHQYHHDYAIWETMRNAFNFCNYLGKTTIHFLEYDNLPDEIQYRQGILERIRDFDAVLYEYEKGSHKDGYVSTFIFSIKTDIALKVINTIKTKEEFFKGKPQKWQLEKNFFNAVRCISKKINITEYIANDNELNTQAVWNRDGLLRNGAKIQLYLAVDDNDDLFLHTISGFHKNPTDVDYLIEVTYQDYKKFLTVQKNEFQFFKLGKYQKGYTVRAYYQGVEILSEFLGDNIETFRRFNFLINKSQPITPKIIMPDPQRILNINFIDGTFVEILEAAKNLYHIQFIDSKTNNVEYGLNLESNHWAKSSKKFNVKWLIKIDGINCNYHFEHLFSPEDKRVLISFESKALGDTLAWFPQVEKFRIENKCEVICSTFHNNLFRGQYPFIKFVEPGTNVSDIYALYRIGVFYSDGKIDLTKNVSNPQNEPLCKISSDILGMEYEELRPTLPTLATEKKKLVSIAIHATAQCKYWNNPSGWQDVTDFLNENGYEVRLLSKEINGYMGNQNPKGLSKVPAGDLVQTIRTLQESQLFIGISSGLSWLSWASGTDTILISGFTDVITEPTQGVRRIINRDVCNSCWNKFTFDPGNWNWCPLHEKTARQFECSKSITSEQVIDQIKLSLGL